jgi:uncharacterized protein (TIGR02246 family)
MTDRQTELAAVDAAMRSYYAAVSRGDAAAAARHFTVPAMFVTPRGTWSPTMTQIETASVGMLREYASQGYSHSTWAESHMTLLGDAAALASIVVVRHRTDGTEIGTFGFTYLLRKADGEWRIAVLIGHPPSDVVRVP